MSRTSFVGRLRKNWLFAGSDAGGRRAAILYSLIGTCKRIGIDPFAYLRDVIARVSTHPMRRIGELTPRGWKAELAATAVS
ncbi:MAG: transposase domain-containing protein [Gemmatimonadota bacterium]|nr:MAG: transposase domain-containing protein [Gemmatimonadota bacterium]